MTGFAKLELFTPPSFCVSRVVTPGVRCEIAIVNSGFGGTRLGRGVGGAIPRERVRKLAAGRRSVRRRRRARARW